MGPTSMLSVVSVAYHFLPPFPSCYSLHHVTYISCWFLLFGATLTRFSSEGHCRVTMRVTSCLSFLMFLRSPCAVMLAVFRLLWFSNFLLNPFSSKFSSKSPGKLEAHVKMIAKCENWYAVFRSSHLTPPSFSKNESILILTLFQPKSNWG